MTDTPHAKVGPMKRPMTRGAVQLAAFVRFLRACNAAELAELQRELVGARLAGLRAAVEREIARREKVAR